MGMFQWIVGQTCNPCIPADPTADTVTFDNDRFSAGLSIEESVHQAQAEREYAAELERQRAEEAERRRQADLREQQWREGERREREEKERLEREKAEEEALERQRQEEAAAFMEAERREQERLEAVVAEERRCQEEKAARRQLEAWLKKNNYATVNTKKSKLMTSNYPLHEATMQWDAAVVRLLLRFGADPSLKNSSNKTPLELATKTKGCEEVVAAFTCQSHVKRGGA